MNLPTTFDPNKMFPIMGGRSVFWEDAEKAYLTYVGIAHGRGQSLKRVGERGGFGASEFAYYFQGLAPTGPGEWPTKSCQNCSGSGEVVNSEEGGLVEKCGLCMGAGLLVPDELPPCRKLETAK